MEEREKACPVVLQVLTDNPDSGSWSMWKCVCVSICECACLQQQRNEGAVRNWVTWKQSSEKNTFGLLRCFHPPDKICVSSMNEKVCLLSNKTHTD